MIKLKTSQRFRKETYIELRLPTATDNLIQEPSLGGQHIAPLRSSSSNSTLALRTSCIETYVSSHRPPSEDGGRGSPTVLENLGVRPNSNAISDARMEGFQIRSEIFVT